MEASIASKPFLVAARTDGSLGSLLPSDLRRHPSPTVRILMRSRTSKKLQVEAARSTFGTHFRVTTFGVSRGGGVGCIADGCSPRIPLSEADMQFDLDRSNTSGDSEGLATGTSIHDYSEMSIVYRPSHAAATYNMKYGVRPLQGGAGSSDRETIGRVASGPVVKKILKLFSGTKIDSKIRRCPDPEYAEKMIAAIDAVRGTENSVGGVVTCIVRNCPF
ncbi:Chorismate synthase [Melia azedarach]|uniref:Chorismate synthase n=2 Tax=Melia azedarach TaxID=155640 RepID=A0ACC1WVN0_MELAZ|nr:Chorismate synthase [Melia azedarach]KAJ4703038.1 Chorismate synthase [Melia azedarach]